MKNDGPVSDSSEEDEPTRAANKRPKPDEKSGAVSDSSDEGLVSKVSRARDVPARAANKRPKLDPLRPLDATVLVNRFVMKPLHVHPDCKCDEFDGLGWRAKITRVLNKKVFVKETQGETTVGLWFSVDEVMKWSPVA